MSDALRKPLYAIDTNVLMEWQFRAYPTDIFATLVHQVDTLISEGRFLAPDLVEEELGAVGAERQVVAEALLLRFREAALAVGDERLRAGMLAEGAFRTGGLGAERRRERGSSGLQNAQNSGSAK